MADETVSTVRPQVGDQPNVWELRRTLALADLTQRGYASSATITRPSNTTAYTAGDAIGVTAGGDHPEDAGSAILTFTAAGPSGGVIEILDAMLEIDVGGIPDAMDKFDLHLYNAAPGAILDNAAWDLASAGDRAKYLGSIQITKPVDLGSTIFAQVKEINKTVKLATSALFGVLVTLGAYTPTSAAVKKVTLITQAI